MDIRIGSRVMVNLAPFIGSRAPSRQSVECRVTGERPGEIEVTTEAPYREVVLWVSARWIDSVVEQSIGKREESLAAAW
jgi:hypothetical protein